MSLELYIHIPFCVRKCYYCDFLSFPAGEEIREPITSGSAKQDGNEIEHPTDFVRYKHAFIEERYCIALMEEIRRTGELLRAERCSALPVSSIFFGGGTPSVLTGRQIARILTCLREEFFIEADAEISIEANPGTVDEAKLSAFKEAGIGRLSIGLQSTEDSLLAALGRIHTFHEFEESFRLARALGFDNINVDLMSALPGQTIQDYENTLRIITDFRPEHISSYSLIVEEGTPLASNHVLLATLPDEDADRKMYELTKETLASCGYHRYEISNYALPGRECRHNKGYWTGTPYLGFGLGASSYFIGTSSYSMGASSYYTEASSYSMGASSYFMGASPLSDQGTMSPVYARFSNTRDMKDYLASPFTPFEKRADYELQSLTQAMEDFMIFGLRMMEGIGIREFEERFGRDFYEVYGRTVGKFAEMGLLQISAGRVRLTDRGIDVSNRIFEEMLLQKI